MSKIAVLGIDLGKNVCSLAGLDETGKVVLRRRMKREGLSAFVERLAPCIIAMEACCGAHHLGRIFADQQHQVRLMSPEYVQPYVKAQKNDDRDAEAIAEAATRPTMRFVDLKSQEQLDMQTLHRARDRLVGERTALINQLRAILLERGIVVPQGRGKLERELVILIDEKQGASLSPRVVKLIVDMRTQWSELDRRIEEFNKEFATFAKADEGARLLVSIPGIGAIIASALIAAIGQAESFAKGRDLAAWLGLVPKQSTTGGKPGFPGSASAAINTSESCSSMALAQRCHPSWNVTRSLGAGRKDCSGGRTKILLWWLSLTNWRGSPGPFCAGGRSLPFEMCLSRRKDKVHGPETATADDVCERWKRDGLTVERQLGIL